MPSFDDKTGRVYGKLTVVELHSRGPKTKWLCVCSCGTQVIVNGNNLVSGNTSSCGCKIVDARSRRKVDLTGATSGFLQYMSEVEASNRPRVICLCRACGNNHEMARATFLDQRDISCGCKSREFASIDRSKNITGQRFGRLTVLSRDPTIKRKAVWICLCDCGKQHSVNTGNLISGGVKSCGCLQREQAAKTAALQKGTKRPSYARGT